LTRIFPVPTVRHTPVNLCDFTGGRNIKAIENFSVRYSRYGKQNPIGVFSCECGFVYERGGPDNCEDDKNRRDRIITFGNLWEIELERLWISTDYSLRKIAERLGVDPRTVIKRVKMLRLKYPRLNSMNYRDGYSKEEARPTDVALFDLNRQRWLLIQQENPNIGITDIRRICPALYTWLNRNDKEWFLTHKPAKLERKVNCSRVDWQKRDASYTCRVFGTVDKLIKKEGRPIRLTITSISRELGCLSLIQKHSDKLPRTKELILKGIETTEEFALRRIIWATNQFIASNQKPEKWKIIKSSGVERYLENEVIQVAIKEAIKPYA
jgi:hypothetical protein